MPHRLRRLLYDLRVEGGGPAREAAAVAVGVFIGCLPVYGLHLLLCVAIGTLLRLNRLKTYLAANISNPLVAPWLLLAEVQAGAWMRRGRVHALSVETLDTTRLSVFGMDLVVGSVTIGGVLAALAAWGTFALARRDRADDWFADLVRRAADRYAATNLTAWEFARGKLRFDPIYRALIADGLLTGAGGARSGTVVEVGCGQGLALALLAEARHGIQSDRWPAGVAPVSFTRMVGIELRRGVARIAAEALAGEAEIVTGDARTVAIEPADAVLFLDILHMTSRDEQEALLAAAATSIAGAGVIVIREADAAGGWRFALVALGNRLKALAFGHWRQRFQFRSVGDWQACFLRLGLRAETRAMGHGTPFANVVFLVRPEVVATPNTRRTDTSNADAA